MSLLRVLIGAAVAIVALVVVVSAGWWFFVREENELATSAPEIPDELVEPTSAATPPAASGESEDGSITFTIISDRSEAAYFADEQLASLPLPSTAKGATNDITGEFHVSEDGYALSESQTSSFTVDLTTLESDEDRRDNRVQNDALQTSQFPTATFTATSVSGIDTSLPLEQEHTFQLTGMLDLHGVQKEVTWEVKAKREGNVMTALATTTFLYADFNITPPNIGGFVSVEDDVTLQVQIIAEAA
jgi:polyisoprenoid-binding protein YceI